jgi:hypothetical protein
LLSSITIKNDEKTIKAMEKWVKNTYRLYLSDYGEQLKLNENR